VERILNKKSVRIETMTGTHDQHHKTMMLVANDTGRMWRFPQLHPIMELSGLRLKKKMNSKFTENDAALQSSPDHL
jgi:hypothetical protein